MTHQEKADKLFDALRFEVKTELSLKKVLRLATLTSSDTVEAIERILLACEQDRVSRALEARATVARMRQDHRDRQEAKDMARMRGQKR